MKRSASRSPSLARATACDRMRWPAGPSSSVVFVRNPAGRAVPSSSARARKPSIMRNCPSVVLIRVIAWCSGRQRGVEATARLDPRGIEQAEAVGGVARLCPVLDSELPVGVGEVELDRLLGHPQLAGDLAVRGAAGDEPEDLQ